MLLLSRYPINGVQLITDLLFAQFSSSISRVSTTMENIYTSVKPFYILMKYLGAFPMTLEGKCEKGNFSRKWHDIVGSSLSAIIPISLLMCIQIFDDGRQSSSTLLSKAWIIGISFVQGLIIFSWCNQQYKCRNITKFLKALNKFDSKVRRSLC